MRSIDRSRNGDDNEIGVVQLGRIRGEAQSGRGAQFIRVHLAGRIDALAIRRDLRPRVGRQDAISAPFPTALSLIESCCRAFLITSSACALRKLRDISTTYNAATEHPAQTAEEFWKDYDAKHPAEKK